MLSALVAAGLVLSQPAAVDGDTLRDAEGERYRVENIDAPERGARARCEAERALAEQARDELIRWVARARRVEAFPVGRRDTFGRVVAYIRIDGVDLGADFIERGLAKPWRGRRADFCSATASRSPSPR